MAQKNELMETGRTCRPSRYGSQPLRKRRKPVGVEELARRYALKLDLWTGEPLKNQDLEDCDLVDKRATVAHEARRRRTA